jgi:hypothetical protein
MNDLRVRAKHGLPLFCPDLGFAIREGGLNSPPMVAIRDDVDARRFGVYVDGYRFAMDTQIDADTDLEEEEVGFALTGPLARKTTMGGPSTGPTVRPAPAPLLPAFSGSRRSSLTGVPTSSSSRAAARAAAAKEAEEKKQFLSAISASAHIVHAVSVLLQVLDAASPPPTAVEMDSGLEPSTSAQSRVSLPPAASLDRLLLSHASRLLYPLATIVATSALSTTEHAFLTRPTGGSASTLSAKYQAETHFSLAFPDYSDDSVATAAALLRIIWARVPLLRSAIAHVVSVTSLFVAISGLGPVTVNILQQTSNAPESLLSIQITEDVIQARYLGIVISRLEKLHGEDGLAHPAMYSRSSDQAKEKSPLPQAVLQRFQNSSLRRFQDGVIIHTIDVEDFDETLI